MKQLFKSKAFNYQALRAMGHGSYYGASAAECLCVIESIKDNDAESWYKGWNDMARRCAVLGDNAADVMSKGRSYLRASNYYRAGEFFLTPADERKNATYNKSADYFIRGISSLKISHEIWQVPYQEVMMRAYHFPGDRNKPLLFICGGYDSTNEESFFWFAGAAIESGYPCVLFEGPGQSNVIRKYGMTFTNQWEKPVKHVIDYALSEKQEYQNRKKILIGISMGAMLALRAAAYEKRIDGAVAFGGFFDMEETALSLLPRFPRILYKNGYRRFFHFFAWLKMKRDIGKRWAYQNGTWTIGGNSPYELLNMVKKYSLKECASDINCHVLILSGEDDHLISAGARRFKEQIINAASFTEHVFRRDSASSEHCQAGALEQAHRVFFDWIGSNFDESDRTANNIYKKGGRPCSVI